MMMLGRGVIHPDGWTTISHDGKRRAVIELTAGELRAVVSAMDSYLQAGTEEECRIIFGSHAGTRAAAEGKSKIVAAGIALGAFKR